MKILIFLLKIFQTSPASLGRGRALHKLSFAAHMAFQFFRLLFAVSYLNSANLSVKPSPKGLRGLNVLQVHLQLWRTWGTPDSQDSPGQCCGESAL